MIDISNCRPDPDFNGKTYERIARTLNLDTYADHEATQILHSLMMGRAEESRNALDRLEELVNSRPAFVFGCGPSLDNHIAGCISYLRSAKVVTIAADGAASALIDREVLPDIVVTDLDGIPSDISLASNRGTIVLLHAHGDNLNSVRRWLPRINNVIPVTQTEPTDLVHNFGGFTDGDKSVHVACLFGCSALLLAGMDFGNEVGRWSSPQGPHDDLGMKLKKLEIGSELTARCISECGAPVYSLPPSPFDWVPEIECQRLPKILGARRTRDERQDANRKNDA